MKAGRTQTSLLLFGLSVILWVMLTLFESALVGMSPGTERFVIFLALVLVPGIGAIFAVMGLTRRESPIWLAVAATVLNSLFALFHLMIVLFAG